jgi:myo-inositol-1(or 4)-monophosphatase
MTTERELLDGCVEAARRGGAVLAERFGEKRVIEHKGRVDLVTDADRASEAAVLGFLGQRFPAAAILAEESGHHGGADAPLRFYVDPLDGTTNYAHGIPHFAVTVAAADRQGLVAGAVLDPVRGELFTASRGGGAFAGDSRIQVSPCADLEQALLVTGFPYDVHNGLDFTLRAFGAFTAGAQSVRRLGSAAIDLAYTAAGRFEGFWEERLKPWDVAAGILLVREAGGVVTDLAGGDTMLSSGDIVAAGPALVGKMLEVIRRER